MSSTPIHVPTTKYLPMATRYLSNGKKVAVLNEITTSEFLVQEVFVDQSGTEVLAGKSFIATSLYEIPVESWYDRRERELKARLNKLEVELETKEKELAEQLKRTKEQIKQYKIIADNSANVLASEIYEEYLSFVSGEYKYVVDNYYYKYQPFNPFNAEYESIDWGNGGFEGYNLITLFGNGNSKTWGKSRYMDSSGERKNLLIFKTEEEAIKCLRERAESRDDYCKEAVEFLIKHNIPLNREKFDRFKTKINQRYIKEKISLKTKLKELQKEHDESIELLIGLKFLDNA